MVVPQPAASGRPGGHISTGASVKFQILGSLELYVADAPINLGPPKQRAILLPLLLEPNTAIGFDTLVERVWDETPPTDVRNVVYTYITRLRRILESVDAGRRQHAIPRIDRRNGGYLLDIAPECIDLHRFYQLRNSARASVDPWECARLQRSALDLWDSTPIANITGGWAGRIREWLDRERLDTMAEWAETEIMLNNSAIVITELRREMANNPHAELLIEKLLHALMQTGRTIEALELYATARGRIVETMGAEPGPRLREIHRALLADEL
ncbi:AfsR/SARP family transcriptional regulator [Nocardia tenerifensis]|uniref:AfsR/SARP family transcriptional regulator n=1 Tax=Nocardia tenerifensis TaxID=228006 RepID=UPI0011B3EDBA|nr:BTAD domain-containing putative transcriptional regulator [Nocardia tenerifensis]